MESNFKENIRDIMVCTDFTMFKGQSTYYFFRHVGVKLSIGRLELGLSTGLYTRGHVTTIHFTQRLGLPNQQVSGTQGWTLLLKKKSS
jgi:hypothetical protein